MRLMETVETMKMIEVIMTMEIAIVKW